MHVVLVAPEIATNTGNIIRLCANTGTVLHVVEPLGFSLDDRHLRRAGLDYHELAVVQVHATLERCLGRIGAQPDRTFALSGRGGRAYDSVAFGPGDVLVFGAERAGLSDEVLGSFRPDRRLRIPMQPGNRSLNLANAVAVVVYEAWRQQGFAGAADAGSGSDGRALGAGARPGDGADVGGPGGTLAESTVSAPFDSPR